MRRRVRVVLATLGALLAGTGRLAAADPLRIVALGGGSAGGRSWESSAFGSVALARDFPLARGSRFAASAELHPFAFERQRQLDRVSRQARLASAFGGLLAFRGGALSAPGWGYRVELGTGLFYSWSGAVPADGTRTNFFDQAGASLVRRGARAWSAGYRFVHVSNLDLAGGARNPGASFHTLVVAFAWR